MNVNQRLAQIHALNAKFAVLEQKLLDDIAILKTRCEELESQLQTVQQQAMQEQEHLCGKHAEREQELLRQLAERENTLAKMQQADSETCGKQAERKVAYEEAYVKEVAALRAEVQALQNARNS